MTESRNHFLVQEEASSPNLRIGLTPHIKALTSTKTAFVE